MAFQFSRIISLSHLTLPLSLTQFSSMLLSLSLTLCDCLSASVSRSSSSFSLFLPHSLASLLHPLSFPHSFIQPFCQLFFHSFSRISRKVQVAITHVQKNWKAILPHWTIMVQDHEYMPWGLSLCLRPQSLKCLVHIICIHLCQRPRIAEVKETSELSLTWRNWEK